MMKFENQGTNTFLVYHFCSEDELDAMSLGMLTNNRIPGLAEAIFTQMDSAKYIKYNVTAKVSASQLFSGPVNKKRLLGVFMGVLDAMISAEEYMLDTGSILLDLDYIFVDVSTCDTVLICLPVISDRPANPELGQFFKNIIFNTQFDQTENCDHVAQILNYLNSNPSLSLTAFKSLLERLAKPSNAARAAKPQPEAPAAVSKPKQTPAAVQAQPVVPQPVSPLAGGQSEDEPIRLDETMRPLTAAPEKNEKQMSLFYLLQHYNKDNAAQYKAQKAAKKTAQNGTQPKQKPQKKEKRPAAPSAPGMSFAIPGQGSSQDSAFQATEKAAPSQVQRPEERIRQTAAPAAVSADGHGGSAGYSSQKPAGGYGAQPEAVPAYRQPEVPPAERLHFGETTVLSQKAGETTVLGVSAEPQKAEPYLLRERNHEKIPLSKPVFRIGKERSYVDYFIGDNTAVSRSHANIVNRDGVFFVVDTNSTNHTYVDGRMIQSNVETRLEDGAKIRLANEEFEFRMY